MAIGPGAVAPDPENVAAGDLDIVEQFAATGYITDATTNPLFVSQAGLSGDPRYVAFVEEAITYAKEKMCNMDGCDVDDAIAFAMDRLAVNLGKNILSLGIKGVSCRKTLKVSAPSAQASDARFGELDTCPRTCGARSRAGHQSHHLH